MKNLRFTMVAIMAAILALGAAYAKGASFEESRTSSPVVTPLSCPPCPCPSQTETRKKSPVPKPTVRNENGVAGTIIYCGQIPCTSPQQVAGARGERRLKEGSNLGGSDSDINPQKPRQYKELPPHEVRIGLKDIHIDLKSPNPYIFVFTLLVSAVIIVGLLRFLIGRIHEGKHISGYVVVVAILAILVLGSIVCIYYSHLSNLADCKQQIQNTIRSPEFERNVSQSVEARIRDDLTSCRSDLAKLDSEAQVLRLSRGETPNMMAIGLGALGLALGMFFGMAFRPFIVRTLLNRETYHRGSSWHDDGMEFLLQELADALKRRDKEIIEKIISDLNPK